MCVCLQLLQLKKKTQQTKKPNPQTPLDSRKQVNGNDFNTALLVGILLTVKMLGMLVLTAGLLPAVAAWGWPSAAWALQALCSNLQACTFTHPHLEVEVQ